MSKKRILSGILALIMCLSVLWAFQISPAMSVAAADSVTVNFYYNYTGAPASRPASFTKTTGDDGKLASFPVEQTLPQVGSRADYGFVGWYKNAEGTGTKVTLDTVFTEDTELYAKWEVTPSLYKEYEDYFLMGAFQDFNANNAQMIKHYNINCPINNFKLTNQINPTTMRNNFTAARTRILNDTTLSEAEKDEALARANEEVVLTASPGVISTLNNMRAWNNSHPDPKDKKYTRFHVIAWHGGQQPNQYFTNGFQYTGSGNLANDNAALAKGQNLRDPNQDGSIASRETMKARLDNYIRQVMARYAEYSDIIVSWDVINEPVDDYSGQIRNGVSDSRSQRGQWGLVWHDAHPARNEDGSLKYTTTADDMGVITDPERLFDESEWMRWAMESSAKWATEYGMNWPLYVNDYMDSNKLYTKLQPTLDIMKDIRDTVDLKGQKLVYGLQGRLAWAYPTIDMLRKQVEDALEICDMVAVTEADIRSDFEPNPFYDPSKPMQQVERMGVNPPQKWVSGDLNSGSGSYASPAFNTLMNTFDTHNSPVRRIPEWGTGNGMSASSERYGATNYLAISEQIMKKQADFAADWMDILVEHADRVELFQWDNTTDANTFNNSKGAHMWVNGISGRSGTFEKYSFYAVIGSPARDKLKKAIAANPALTDASKYSGISQTRWNNYVAALNTATALLDKRIYTLEGVNDVKDATAKLNAAAANLSGTIPLLTYDANGGTGSVVRESGMSYDEITIKTDAAVGFTNAGYTFSGWNTAANGSGTAYAGGDTLEFTNANITLYAQWTANPAECTVTFESYNAGTGTTLNNAAVPPVKVLSGNKIAKPADPVKPGYYFAGWYTDMALTNAWNFNSDIVKSNMMLYAKWTTVNFAYNGHAAKPGEIVGGSTITLSAQTMDAGRAQTMFVGLYNAKGALVKIIAVEGVLADGVFTFNADFEIPGGNYSGGYFQVFVWDSLAYTPAQPEVKF